MSAGPMPPPPLKWQPVQFIWLNSCWPSAMASLCPSNRPPIASGGDGGATPLGKRLVTETSLGPRPRAWGSVLLRPRVVGGDDKHRGNGDRQEPRDGRPSLRISAARIHRASLRVRSSS